MSEDKPRPENPKRRRTAQSTGNSSRRQRPQAPQPTVPLSPEQSENNENGRSRTTGVAILVFMGSMLGTLLGTFTSINDMFDSLDRVNEVFNPPPQLCVAGSNTILGEGLGMAAQWEEVYEESSEVDVVVKGIGSLAGVDAAAAGECVHVLAMSEAMTPSQYDTLQANGIEIACAAEIGYDVIAFVTDKNNQLSSLLERRMESILTGRITDWEDVRGDPQPIYIFARPGSGTTDYVLKQFRYDLGAELLPPRANYIECNSNSECLDLTLATPGALYWVSTAWMRTQPPQYLRVLPILQGDEAPINPLRDNVDIRDYPRQLVRPLYMYVLNNPNMTEEERSRARDFLQYIRSVEGQQILESNFFYTYFDQPREVPLDFPEGFEVPDEGIRSVCHTS